MTFPFASAIIIKHSANAYRGIAQLVEQRSPKPRAVSSKLTTPAMTHRFFGTCAFCFSPSGTSASFMALTGNFAATAKATPSGSLRSPAPPRGRLCTMPETLPLPPKAVPLGKVAATKGSRRKGSLPAFAKNCIFCKFVLDNRPTFRYNRARSRGKMPHELERSWPGSSVG